MYWRHLYENNGLMYLLRLVRVNAPTRVNIVSNADVFAFVWCQQLQRQRPCNVWNNYQRLAFSQERRPLSRNYKSFAMLRCCGIKKVNIGHHFTRGVTMCQCFCQCGCHRSNDDAWENRLRNASNFCLVLEDQCWRKKVSLEPWHKLSLTLLYRTPERKHFNF